MFNGVLLVAIIATWIYCKVDELLKTEGLKWKIAVNYAQMLQKLWWAKILVLYDFFKLRIMII